MATEIHLRDDADREKFWAWAMKKLDAVKSLDTFAAESKAANEKQLSKLLDDLEKAIGKPLPVPEKKEPKKRLMRSSVPLTPEDEAHNQKVDKLNAYNAMRQTVFWDNPHAADEGPVTPLETIRTHIQQGNYSLAAYQLSATANQFMVLTNQLGLQNPKFFEVHITAHNLGEAFEDIGYQSSDSKLQHFLSGKPYLSASGGFFRQEQGELGGGSGEFSLNPSSIRAAKALIARVKFSDADAQRFEAMPFELRYQNRVVVKTGAIADRNTARNAAVAIATDKEVQSVVMGDKAFLAELNDALERYGDAVKAFNTDETINAKKEVIDAVVGMAKRNATELGHAVVKGHHPEVGKKEPGGRE